MLLLLGVISSGLCFGQNLKVVYGPDWGIRKITYQGQVFMDLDRNIGRALSPEAFKVKRKDKTIWSDWSQFIGRAWDEKTLTFIAEFNWGKYECKYSNTGDTLNLKITFTNRSATDTFCGMSFCPLTFQFAKRPANFQEFFPYYGNNIAKPAVLNADLPNTRLVIENAQANSKSYVGLLEENGTSGTWYRVWTGNHPYNGMKDFDAGSELRVAPGKSYTYNISLKFCKPDLPMQLAARSVLGNFRKSEPFLLRWADRRPIGALFLASFKPEKKASNLRNWSVAPNESLDLRSSAGQQILQQKVFEFADNSIRILKDMNSQGMITWDIEGQEYPHPLSYIGSPEILATMAPEMNKIADEYFKKFRNAGFRTGICIRPDSVIFTKNNTWIDHAIVKDPAQNLIKKIRYANKRWGCTIFYIDSNIEPSGEPMDYSVFKKVAAACPDVLLIPEHERVMYFPYTAPYGEMRSGTITIGEEIRSIYPEAFMVLNTSDGLEGTEQAAFKKLSESISQGNILLFRAWYNDQPANRILKQAMQSATKKSY